MDIKLVWSVECLASDRRFIHPLDPLRPPREVSQEAWTDFVISEYVFGPLEDDNGA